MKKIILFVFAAIAFSPLFAKDEKSLCNITFVNDYDDVYHLALIIYTPSGNNYTKVSNVKPKEEKNYVLELGAEIYIANWQEEAFAMKGNDIKAKGLKPYLVLTQTDSILIIKLSEIKEKIKTTDIQKTITKVQIDDILGNWKIDLKPSPESENYFKFFKITKIDDKKISGEFYDTNFTDGVINTVWDKIYFSFTTKDKTSTYFHSGYIENNFVFGMSYNEKRQMLIPWNGIKN